MKKIILILVAFCSLSAQGAVTNLLSSYGLTSDTVTNTGTSYLEVTVNGVYQQLAFQVVITEISGTTDGNVILQGSVDGVNFSSIGSDTLDAADVASQSHVFICSDAKYLVYRVSWTGTGTMSASFTAKLWAQPGRGASHVRSNMLDAADLEDDTIANTATGYVSKLVPNYWEYVTIQAVVTKLSGTAAGTVTLQGSIDGTNFVTVKSSYLNGTATLSVTNVTTNAKIFVVTGSPYKYYRLSYTGSGTMSCKLNGYILTSKQAAW